MIRVLEIFLEHNGYLYKANVHDSDPSVNYDEAKSVLDNCAVAKKLNHTEANKLNLRVRHKAERSLEAGDCIYSGPADDTNFMYFIAKLMSLGIDVQYVTDYNLAAKAA